MKECIENVCNVVTTFRLSLHHQNHVLHQISPFALFPQFPLDIQIYEFVSAFIQTESIHHSSRLLVGLDNGKSTRYFFETLSMNVDSKKYEAKILREQ